MEDLNYYTHKIAGIFKAEKDRYKAHELSRPLLEEMGRKQEILFNIFRKNLLDKKFINKPRHYPNIGLEIFQNEDVGITGNCFMPLADRSTDLSFQSIHHHGKLLLTTVAVFGPGYESILFRKGFTVNSETKTADMQIEKQYQFTKGNVEFVDSNQPHVVFFPKDVSITYAMWAYEKANTITQSLKKIFIVKKFKEPIRKLLKITGLLEKAGVNYVENLDFYPEDKRIMILKERIGFDEGTNENFLTNVFYLLQKTGFNDTDFLESLKSIHPENKFLHNIIDKYNAKEVIQDEFYEFHKNIPYVNLKKQDILNVYN